MRRGLIFVTSIAPGRGRLLGTQTGAEDRGEADDLLQGWMFRIDQVGQEQQVLGFSDCVTFATFSDLLLLHSQQVSNRRVFLRLKYKYK